MPDLEDPPEATPEPPTKRPGFHRLSVNINDDAAEVLRRVTKERRISTTEAVRRAIGLLAFFEDARERKLDVYTKDKKGTETTLQMI